MSLIKNSLPCTYFSQLSIDQRKSEDMLQIFQDPQPQLVHLHGPGSQGSALPSPWASTPLSGSSLAPSRTSGFAPWPQPPPREAEVPRCHPGLLRVVTHIYTPTGPEPVKNFQTAPGYTNVTDTEGGCSAECTSYKDTLPENHQPFHSIQQGHHVPGKRPGLGPRGPGFKLEGCLHDLRKPFIFAGP